MKTYSIDIFKVNGVKNRFIYGVKEFTEKAARQTFERVITTKCLSGEDFSGYKVALMENNDSSKTCLAVSVL